MWKLVSDQTYSESAFGGGQIKELLSDGFDWTSGEPKEIVTETFKATNPQLKSWVFVLGE